MNDVPHAPWRLADADGRVRDKGLDFDLLRAFEARTGWRVELQVQPGRRCHVEQQLGRVDGTVGLSHSPERADILRFPLKKGGQPDLRFVLRWDGYSLYHRPGSGVRWDGKALHLPSGAAVDVLQGHSVADDLRRAGYPVRDRERQASSALRSLVHGVGTVAALQTSEANELLRREPELASLQRLDPAYVVKPYFVVFSHEFARAHEAEMEGLWKAFSDAAAGVPGYRKAAQTQP